MYFQRNLLKFTSLTEQLRIKDDHRSYWEVSKCLNSFAEGTTTTNHWWDYKSPQPTFSGTTKVHNKLLVGLQKSTTNHWWDYKSPRQKFSETTLNPKQTFSGTTKVHKQEAHGPHLSPEKTVQIN